MQACELRNKSTIRMTMRLLRPFSPEVVSHIGKIMRLNFARLLRLFSPGVVSHIGKIMRLNFARLCGSSAPNAI